MARKVDASLLAGLVQGAEGQEIVKGVQKSTDPKFPVFKTPVNENILVYIPRTNVMAGENGEVMKMLETHIHDYKRGKSYGQLRCINGLSNPVFNALGYDGVCPACEGMKEVWELYNLKLGEEAKKLGVDPQNDPSNLLEGAKKRILGEMDLSNADEYVTFPIVIIPTSGKMQPTEDALKNLKVVFVQWKKKRYNDSIVSALDTLMENPGHPAGMFWMWNFTYDTQGKQANARDSAKNAKYIPITDGKATAKLESFIKPCEEASAEFTLVKAAEVVVSNQFMYKEDLQAEVDKVLAKTRQMLDLAQAGGMGGQPQIGTAQPNVGGGNLLSGFTGTNTDLSSQPVQGDLGTPQGANPIQFGN